jgi:hypothetical protein
VPDRVALDLFLYALGLFLFAIPAIFGNFWQLPDPD